MENRAPRPDPLLIITGSVFEKIRLGTKLASGGSLSAPNSEALDVGVPQPDVLVVCVCCVNFSLGDLRLHAARNIENIPRQPYGNQIT